MIQPAASTPAEVLTDLEACEYLRIRDGKRSDAACLAALERLVGDGKLRPVKIGNKRRFWRGELLDFLKRETQRYTPIRRKNA